MRAATPQRLIEARIAKSGSGNRPADEGYERLRDLPRLIALWPREVHDKSVDGALTIIAKLRQAMRAERRRGTAGHWSYDLERHLSLARALKAEVACLNDKRRPSIS